MLVATGRCAEKIVKETVGAAADVLVLDIDIAALMTPRLVRDAYAEFTRKHGREQDVILIPGAANPANFAALAHDLSVKIALGPKQAYDLGLVLESFDESLFSLNESADRLIREKRQREALNLLAELERAAMYDFKIGDLKIGGNSRMKVLGEIIDAPFGEAKRMALQHIRNGADIIDLGIPLGTAKREVTRTFEEVGAVAAKHHVPLSVDSLDPQLICAGMDAGAELILSLTADNASEIAPSIAKKDLAVVVLPKNGDVCATIALARSLGIRKIIADPVLYPIGGGASNSLAEYHRVRSVSRVPLFLGVGNVVELMEADSIGANALLAGLAMELGVSVLFTPEHSDKAKGSVNELRTAAQMMQLARFRKSPPKDLGIDLLLLKERRRRPEYQIMSEHLLDAHDFDTAAWTPDPAGNFVIGIKDGAIIARHDTGTAIRGTNAKTMLDAIFELELVSSTSHAAYLGRELKKAEIALKLGRSYAQDDEF